MRVLVAANWLFGAGILVLLTATFVSEPWTMRALGVSGYADGGAVMMGMRGIAALGLVCIPHVHAILARVFAEGTSMREDLEGTV